jgi:CBS-domain-containing membrane protein
VARVRRLWQGNAKIVDLGWMYLILPLLAGNCVCVIVASVFNNAIPGRQYPVFW